MSGGWTPGTASSGTTASSSTRPTPAPPGSSWRSPSGWAGMVVNTCRALEG
uniref:Czog1 n=1 Tax=Arundo donax TaxID=35708 RepID=A0A0A8ZN14_ARUDO